MDAQSPESKKAPSKSGFYQRGRDFPNEGFVQASVERYFIQLGFEIKPEPPTDLVATCPDTGETWQVEAKGQTEAIGTDFHTGLGQLVHRMSVPTRNYAIAIPNIPQFINQCQRVSDWVRERLDLSWLVVAEDGTVKKVCPGERL